MFLEVTKKGEGAGEVARGYLILENSMFHWLVSYISRN